MKKNKINQEENIILDEETKIDDKKKPTAKKIAFAILLILLAVMFVVLGFCVVGGVFDVQTQCNVAYAYDATLPDDGIPNQNLIKNSNFLLNTKGSSSYSSSAGVWTRVYDNWQILNADVAYVGDSLNVNFDTSTAAEYKRFCSTADYFYNLEPNKTYTLSVCYSVIDVSGTVSCRINNAYSSIYNSDYLTSGFPSVDLVKTSGVHISSCTFTLAKSLPQGRVEILAQNNAVSHCNINLYWFKLEEGDVFTGYVPCDDDLRLVYDSMANWRFYYLSSKISALVEPIGTGLYEPAQKSFVSKDTNLKVFLVPRSTKISDIINDDFTLKLKIKGLNTNDDVVRGVCYNLFDLTGYREYYYICAMALQTPKTRPSEGATNGCLIYSYDTKTKSLYEITPYTFPDKTTEERYLDIVNFYEDFGRNSEQFDFNSTSNGIISVIESPVNFLKDVFNFEIFGINVSAVVFFVLSIVIVAFVIKKVV